MQRCDPRGRPERLQRAPPAAGRTMVAAMSAARPAGHAAERQTPRALQDLCPGLLIAAADAAFFSDMCRQAELGHTRRASFLPMPYPPLLFCFVRNNSSTCLRWGLRAAAYRSSLWEDNSPHTLFLSGDTEHPVGPMGGHVRRDPIAAMKACTTPSEASLSDPVPPGILSGDTSHQHGLVRP
jgi:hypothetical protein